MAEKKKLYGMETLYTTLPCWPHALTCFLIILSLVCEKERNSGNVIFLHKLSIKYLLLIFWPISLFLLALQIYGHIYLLGLIDMGIIYYVMIEKHPSIMLYYMIALEITLFTAIFLSSEQFIWDASAKISGC